MLELFKRMWIGWGAFARGIIRAQNAILMGTAYFVALGPVVVWMRLTGRKMLDHAPADPKAKTHWQPRDPTPMDMARANRQF